MSRIRNRMNQSLYSRLTFTLLTAIIFKMTMLKIIFLLLAAAVITIGCAEKPPQNYPEVEDVFAREIKALEQFIDDMENAAGTDDYIRAIDNYTLQLAKIYPRMYSKMAKYNNTGNDDLNEDFQKALVIINRNFQKKSLELMPLVVKGLETIKEKSQKEPSLKQALDRLQEISEVVTWPDIYPL